MFKKFIMLDVSVGTSFLMLRCILSFEYTAVCLAVHLYMDIWVISRCVVVSPLVLRNTHQSWKLSGISVENPRCHQSSSNLVELRLQTLSSCQWGSAEISFLLFLPTIISIWATLEFCHLYVHFSCQPRIWGGLYRYLSYPFCGSLCFGIRNF